jgi:hypothetical protein
MNRLGGYQKPAGESSNVVRPRFLHVFLTYCLDLLNKSA